MKYRHSFHAGNFADVHKHVTLLALLAALERKEKGFLYFESHAGRGAYDLSGGSAEAAGGIGRFLASEPGAAELQHYAALLARLRAARASSHFYPGSPLIALAELRPQDRAILVEWQAAEAQALRAAVGELGDAAKPEAAQPARPRVRIEHGDGLKLLRAALPPPERRALIFIDPPFEESREEFVRVTAAVADGLRRFATGVFTVWYPIKEQRVTAAWQAEFARAVAAPTLAAELWLYPRDSRVSLNGSGLLIANPPWQTGERMRAWLPELASALGAGASGGSEVRMLSQ
ncbi:MAG TPA: 23S rRNA (adenine(2030)-N(6))-methyltransferase RlmJ [Steroidobacteraceae bacterium]|nr:23S rRNA (adenine(2030)-N(6))-methyltransferase RlmJ [Steroidobacteraceae bacterium]